MGKGIPALKIALTAIFFSVEISYVIRELRQREWLCKLMRIDYIPDKNYIYRFLSRFNEKDSVALVLSILNNAMRKKKQKKSSHSRGLHCCEAEPQPVQAEDNQKGSGG